MNLPFSVDQFIGVFVRYNLELWPMHLAAYILGAAAVYLAIFRKPYSDRAINFTLAFFWLWNGVVYHLTYFSAINRAAYLFGALFIVQGLMFFALGLRKETSVYRYDKSLTAKAGGILILYAMVLYPAAGYLLGHGYPSSPPFGLAPCPTTIFTLGLLLWTGPSLSWIKLLVPLIWSAIGFNAALKLGILEDVGLLLSGIIAAGLFLQQKRAASREKIQGHV